MDGIETQERWAANPPGLTAILQGATVFIAGAGGLGSNVAIMLARAGIGRLIVADFDRVSLSNLNRQAYTMNQIGCPKVTALRDNLREIVPELPVETRPLWLSEKNFAAAIPADVNLICECFDVPEAKAALVRFVLMQRRGIPLVAVSGIGGIGRLEELRTVSPAPGLYLIGDGVSEIADGCGTVASRVMAAAAAQAHCAIRLLAGEKP
ncbi:MAG: sulfur carrier protein ThiS adenylyltransferase ThiF [Victivallales bacterium]|nr:sulfur carrier protein ThiS adenylyltransferase ThiF [Victivallales bacterium]